jgi:hypothetical protein
MGRRNANLKKMRYPFGIDEFSFLLAEEYYFNPSISGIGIREMLGVGEAKSSSYDPIR